MTATGAPPSSAGADARLDFAATKRNRAPMLEHLRRWLPADGRVLEVAAGSGQHAVYFAAHLSGVTWQATDPDPRHRASIDAWRKALDAGHRVPPALALDARDEVWPEGPWHAVVATNLVHIAPWSVTEALMRGAARSVVPNGALILYGPYHRDGQPTAPSNAAFDADLRSRDPAWGVRDLEAVVAAAAAAGWLIVDCESMPANNLMLRFERAV